MGCSWSRCCKAKEQDELELVNKASAGSFIAIYGYQKRNHQELTMHVNDRLDVLEDKQYQGWWLVRLVENGQQGYAPSNYLAKIGSLQAEKWFFDNTSRNEAERLLKCRSNKAGAFLIRRAESRDKENHEFSLSAVKSDLNYPPTALSVSNIVTHFRIFHNAVHQGEGAKYYILKNHRFDTLQELVFYHVHHRHQDLTLLTPCYKTETPATIGLGVDRFEIEKCSLRIVRTLGTGNFGRVYQATWQGTSKPLEVAVKELKPEGKMTQDDFLKEAEVMKKLNHPKLVQLLAVSTREEPIQIVTELMENGSLDKYLKDHASRNNFLDEQIMIQMSIQVAQGMAYLEREGYVHRDLAARNVLVGSNHLCKVADFGLAKPVIDEEVYERVNDMPKPIKWTAPEAFNDDYSSKSDVWSFGILLTEIVSHGQSPYPGIPNREILERVKNQGYRMTRENTPTLSNCPEELHDIMMDCWKLEPEKRLQFVALVDVLENYKIAIYSG